MTANHGYTDDQINEAIMQANQTSKVYAWEIEMYRNVIKHLPDPQDDWEECTFEDIQKGDRVKLVCKVGQLGGSPSVVEVEPVVVNPEYITWARNNSLGIIEKEDVQTVYRIPAPVVHPDPEVDKYILVHKADPKYNRHMFPNVGMSNGISGYGVSHIHIPSEHILEWEELTPKVVEDDR